MYYLIDGYNFLFRLETTKGKSLEERRESLVFLLNEQLAPFKGGAAVIFDSAEQIREFAQCAKLDHLEVLYAPKGLTADNYIIELAEQNKSPNFSDLMHIFAGNNEFHIEVFPVVSEILK